MNVNFNDWLMMQYVEASLFLVSHFDPLQIPDDAFQPSGGPLMIRSASCEVLYRVPCLYLLLTASVSGLNAQEVHAIESCPMSALPSTKQLCLFYCKEAEPLARRVAEDHPSVELRPIQWG